MSPSIPTRKRLTSTALPLVLAFGVAGGLQVLELPLATPLPAAQAQSNPCAPARAVNPCAPANPCAAVKPMAPAAANPCAPAAVNPSAVNPCAAANPCAPAKAAMMSAAAANPFDLAAGLPQAPFGDKMPAIVDNYGRAAPYVGTGGLVKLEALPQLKALGFKTVVNLRTAEEDPGAEAQAAAAAGLDYVSIPVSAKAPTAEQVAAFTTLVEDPAHYPILVHCHSANRVGALWTLYRAGRGVPPEVAIQEGRTVGMTAGREAAVRQVLKLPPQGS
ncbi:TIGR01244 family protein [Tistlia consotensis]|uniref:TIGR01244 family protein n=1 Tax=Tistlia consotensis USBA 355 TaxID=560819 RepID=A0A1Y6CNA7_9PROT|nr:protein tyrosine phosphatase family protein [Tistlia consotensis]SMF78085.1 TIGR01244 family protein [Tistlia consotensis USBA 355]SNS17730.1 TIGR01244 family protein [Tistlia consotensis]